MQDVNWLIEADVLMRLVLAILLGGIIGWEREVHGRPAGFRTHVVVCLGATMMILASEYFRLSQGASTVFNPDRMAAGIITGIGFLGAGAIMRDVNVVRGLTTAGCIWFVAGLGIVIGKSYYSLALWATLLAWVTLFFFRFAETLVPILNFQDFTLAINRDDFNEVKKKCLVVFEKNAIEVEEKKFFFNAARQVIEVTYTLRFKGGLNKEDILLDVSGMPGVIEVRL